MRQAAACLCLLTLGCTTDIRLGDLPGAGPPPLADGGGVQDGAVDAGERDGGEMDAGRPDSGPWVPPRPLPPDGRYRLAYLPGAEVRCVGLDPFRFSTMTSTEAGLRDGDIEIALRGSLLEVAGPTIRESFGVDPIQLTQTSTEGVFLGAQARDGAGPLECRAVEGRLRMDIEVPAPLPPETEAQVRFEGPSEGHWCEVAFRALLTRQDGG